MKLIKVLALSLVALVMAHTAVAQERIAVVDIQTAILSTDLAQERIKAVQASADYKKHKKQAEGLSAELEELSKKFQKNASVMGQEQQIAQAEAIQSKRKELEFAIGQLRAKEQKAIQGVVRQFESKIQAILQELIKAESIGLLLNSQAAVHVDNAFNITAKVTDKLNKAN